MTAQARGHSLEHRIPPPVVGVLLAVGMWWLARMFPGPSFPLGLRIALATVLALGGLAFLIPATRAFLGARTTVNPLKPEAATTLVVAGAYRFTRNPMYVGFARGARPACPLRRRLRRLLQARPALALTRA